MSFFDIYNNVMFWVLAALLGLNAYNIVFHKDIPNIRTAPAIRKKIIELIKQDRQARGGNPYTIVDLGSGNGRLTREIARALPQARVIGIELAPQTFMVADWLRRRARLENLEYKRMNFLSYDVSGADAIVMYLVPYLMGDLGRKLHKETRPGTLILSNKFKLGDGWTPDESLRIHTLYLHQRSLHIYRKR